MIRFTWYFHAPSQHQAMPKYTVLENCRPSLGAACLSLNYPPAQLTSATLLLWEETSQPTRPASTGFLDPLHITS